MNSYGAWWTLIPINDNQSRMDLAWNALRRWSGPSAEEDDKLDELNANKLCRKGVTRSSLWLEPACCCLADAPFRIPRGYAGKPRSLSLNVVGAIDPSQYTRSLSQEESTASSVIGRLKFTIEYCRRSSRLLIEVHALSDVKAPAASITGSTWSCDPTYGAWVLPEKRRIHCKKTSDVTRFKVHVKQCELLEKTLRISAYDKHFDDVRLPIGHVVFPLRDTMIINEKLEVTKPLTTYSQPAGANKGNIKLSVTWLVSVKRLEVKIGEADSLKSPRGVLGRDFYTRLNVFVSGEVYRTFKTVSSRANPCLDFREKFTMAMTSNQLQQCCLVFTVCAKNCGKLASGTNKIGSTIIGPYMRTVENNELTQWESLVTKPFEEITQVHKLCL